MTYHAYQFFCVDRLEGFGVANFGLSTNLRRHHYNTLALPWECVIGFHSGAHHTPQVGCLAKGERDFCCSRTCHIQAVSSGSVEALDREGERIDTSSDQLFDLIWAEN